MDAYIDTAGLRETDDSIEKEGIERSFEQAQLADIILLVFDGSRMLTEREQSVYSELCESYKNKILCVRTKIDLPQTANPWHVNRQADRVEKESGHAREPARVDMASERELEKEAEVKRAISAEYFSTATVHDKATSESIEADAALLCEKAVSVSTKDKNSISLLEDVLKQRVDDLFGSTECPFLLNTNDITRFY